MQLAKEQERCKKITKIPITSDFDLSLLKEFNPALIYEFQPQDASSERYSDHEQNFADYTVYLAAQYEDIYLAYQYLQDVVLPILRKTPIEQLTIQQIMNWLDEIHLRIARTMQLDMVELGHTDIFAGRNCPVQLYRSVSGFNLENTIKLYIVKVISADEFYNICDSYDIDSQEVADLIALLINIADRNVELGPDEKEVAAKNKIHLGDLIFLKLTSLYHSNKLTSREIDTVEKIFKIKHPPSKLQSIKEKYASDLLVKLKKCSRDDRDSIIDLCHFVFLGITSGHWYFDANTRAATCFMNLWLRYFDFPSILMRNPEDKNNPNSSYSKAINNINKQPMLLFKHIDSQLKIAEDARKKGTVVNQTLSHTLIHRVRIKNILLKIQLLFPSYDIDTEALNKSKKCVDILRARNQENLPQDEYVLKGLEVLATQYEQLLSDLMRVHEGKLKDKYKTNDTTLESLEFMLRKAAADGNFDDLQYLIKRGGDVNKADSKRYQRTALHWAVINNRVEVVGLLLRSNADVDKIDKEKNKPQGYVSEATDPTIKQLLACNVTTCKP